MKTELVLLGILLILMCIIDYIEFKDESKDIDGEDEK